MFICYIGVCGQRFEVIPMGQKHGHQIALNTWLQLVFSALLSLEWKKL